MAGITACHHARRHVPGHHGPGGNDGACADGDAGATVTPPPIQTLSSMVMGAPNSSPVFMHGGGDRMPGGVQSYPGTQQHIAADGDGGHIQKDTVVIGEEIVPYGDVGAVVTAERGLDPAVLSHGTQQSAQDLVPARSSSGGASLYCRHSTLARCPGLAQDLVSGVVQPARTTIRSHWFMGMPPPMFNNSKADRRGGVNGETLAFLREFAYSKYQPFGVKAAKGARPWLSRSSRTPPAI